MFLRANHRYFFLLPLMVFASLVFSPMAFAQLKMSQTLGETWAASVSKETPSFIYADLIRSRPELEVFAKGNAEIRNATTVIQADEIHYNQVSDVAKLSGDVRVNQNGNRFFGPNLELGLTDFTGFFSQPSYQFYKTGGQGRAERINFVSRRSAIAQLASYSTCKAPTGEDGKPWKPDWIMTADRIEFDMEEDVATASGATLRFKGVPILSAPSVSFPMSDARKSGFLSPSFASDSQSGLIVTQPYYWNIAPQRDATLYPSFIGQRGLNYGGEFRYLEPNSTGTLKADYLPNDRLFGDTRWSYSTDQRTLLKAPFESASDINMRLQLNRVSDHQYWRDLPNSTTGLTRRLLNNELNTTINLNGWATQARLQRWQTLQNKSDVIAPPFDRNQLVTRRGFQWPSGVGIQLEGDVTEFRSDPNLTQQPNGTRAYVLAQVSKSWSKPWGYTTPKIQWHGSSYYLEKSALGLDSTKQRALPTFSLDSGLFFERDTTLVGHSLVQTLEPRVFYVRTPYVDQSSLPNYDSGAKDFSLSTIYSENSFVGNDRISDMNMLTLGVNSKFLHAQSGTQLFSAGIAQRFSYIDQQVGLTSTNTTTSNNRLSDYLINISARPMDAWSMESTVQFGVNSGMSERATFTTRYTPSNYRSLYAAYRKQQGVSEQIDVGWQWPLGDLLGRFDDASSSGAGRGLGADRWYSVSRFNYSAFDKRLVKALAGFEYDADCWVGRFVLEKTQLDANTANRRLMFQIEFSGFSRVGISPQNTLRNNIPRYQNLREQITTPSRFSQYD